MEKKRERRMSHWSCAKKKLGEKYSVVHKAKYLKDHSFFHWLHSPAFPCEHGCPWSPTCDAIMLVA